MNRKLIAILCLFALGTTSVNAQDVLYRYTVENMKVLNSIYSELSLMPHTDTTYFLVSDRGGKNKNDNWIGGVPYDLYMVDRRDWTNVWPAEALNTKFSDGPASFLNEDELYITQTSNRGQIDAKTGNFIYRLAIVRAYYAEGQWNIEAIPEFRDKKHSYAHPAISSDGTMLFFSSDLPGGFGGKDLYVSTKRGNSWSEPVNLGDKVNTKRDELFPFYHASGRLYFSSTRTGGLGGLDIYETHLEGGVWAEPKNLQEPINSSANEYAVYFDPRMERGYFSSNRLGGRGGDDIYAVFIDKLMLGPKEDAAKPAVQAPKTSTATTPVVRKPVVVGGDAQQRAALAELNTILKDESLKNVYFDMGSAAINAEGKRVLDRMVTLLKKYSDPVLELHAHADATGNFQQNVQLTERRARSVMQYLIANGMPLSRMSYRAYGESALIVDSEEDVLLNRRVEFRLMLFDGLRQNGEASPANAVFASKSLPMLEKQRFYVQVAALSASSLFKSYNLREYGAPICYFENEMYKYVLGPYTSYAEAKSNLPHIREEYNDAFIFKNE